MEKSQSSIKSSEQQSAEESGRQISGIAFPAYGLADSIAVANAIHNKGGGYATREQLAAFLDYKSTSNGAFLSRVGAAKLFGLLVEENKNIRKKNGNKKKWIMIRACHYCCYYSRHVWRRAAPCVKVDG